MTRAGAPIRFLAFVLGGWVAMRVALLWPTTGAEALAPLPLRPLAHVVGEALAATAPPGVHTLSARDRASAFTPPKLAAVTRSLRVPAPTSYAPPESPPETPPPGAAIEVASDVPADAPIQLAPAPTQAPLHSQASPRLSASAWGIVRGTGSRGAIATPQLGGSQAGVRFAYALSDARRFAATLRLASALRDPDREVAPGIEWRMPHVPVRLFAEHRIALGRNRGGPTAGAIAGISRTLPARFTLDGYAQGGVIARDGGEGFADGAIRVDRAMAHAGAIAVTLGAGAWGAVQRDASRVDIGPTLAARVPVAGGGLRVALDWRQRIAGNARPATGPALSIGADF